MHLPIKVVRQPAIVIQPRKIRAADVANLELLVARGTARFGERAEFALFVFLGGFGETDLVELGSGEGYAAGVAEDGDFEEAGVDGLG